MGKELGSGIGSLYFDKGKEKWVLQRYIMDYQTGKTKRTSKSFSSKEEGEKYQKSLMYQKENPVFIKNNGIPINEIMKGIIQKKFDSNLIGERQYLRLEKTLEFIEKCPISKKNVDEITADELQSYFNSLTDYSNSFIKKVVELYAQAFKYCMDKGYTTRNPLSEVIKPKSKKKDKVIRALEIEEQQALTDILVNSDIKENPYKNAFLIQMYMGLRIGEVLALQNSDIDLKHDLINVDKTLTTDINERVVIGNSTKTYAGIRQVPIPYFIKPYIIEQMQIGKNNQDNQLFLSSNGKLVDPRNANIKLKKILKDNLDITDITTHSLRHTYGTRCIEAGMRAVALQRLMGHKDVSVTLNVYTSVFNKYKQSEIEKVNDYYMNNALIGENKLLRDTEENELEV